MKTIVTILFLVIGPKIFAQTTENITEEKSSAWITVSVPAPLSRPPVTAVKKKTTTTKKPPVKKEEESFDKTNNQVNRFKKKG